MKLQKHPSRKAKNGGDYFKWEVILPKEAVEKAEFNEGEELEAKAKKGEIKLRRKAI